MEVGLYEQLPKLKVLAVRGPRMRLIDGDDYDDPILSTCSISTYPKLPTGEKDGEPIADRLYVQLHENRAVVAVADGCNWGRRPQMAARDAVAALSNYITEKQELIRDVQDAGHYLLRSFAEAHNRIVSGKDDIWEAGTTTLIGTLILELETENEGDPKWGVLCASVGDCKAFIAQPNTKQIVDVTNGNRNNVADGRDPGGRLGPYIGQGWPDLRNLRLYYTPCNEGDIIVIMSDGIHDNLDPQTLGKVPQELSLPNKTWDELSHDALLDSKASYMRTLLRDLIFPEGEGVSPTQITQRLITHCVEVTRRSREYMEEDPSRKQPMDYIAFPGKMDHTTCVTYIIGAKPAA